MGARPSCFSTRGPNLAAVQRPPFLSTFGKEGRKFRPPRGCFLRAPALAYFSAAVMCESASKCWKQQPQRRRQRASHWKADLFFRGGRLATSANGLWTTCLFSCRRTLSLLGVRPLVTLVSVIQRSSFSSCKKVLAFFLLARRSGLAKACLYPGYGLAKAWPKPKYTQA